MTDSSGNLASITSGRPSSPGRYTTQSGRLPFAERVLERVGVLGEPIGHDRFHAALAEGAARLLVGEHVLERDHVRGKLGDARLGRVDDGQPLVELAKGLRGGACGSRYALAESMRHGIQPFVYGMSKIGLAACKYFGKRLHAAGGLDLPARDFFDALFQIGAFVGARAARARKGDQERNEENEHSGAQRQQHMSGGDLDAEQRDKNFAHAILVARFEAQ